MSFFMRKTELATTIIVKVLIKDVLNTVCIQCVLGRTLSYTNHLILAEYMYILSNYIHSSVLKCQLAMAEILN